MFPKSTKFAIFALLVVASAAIFLHVVEFRISWNLVRGFVGSLHGPGAGALAVIAMLCCRQFTSAPRAYLLACVGTIVFSAATEFLQFFGPRDADLRDLLHNVTGIVGFLGSMALFDKSVRHRIRGWRTPAIAVVAAIGLVAAISPGAWYAYSIAAQYQALPLLQSFETRWERQSIRRFWNRRFHLRPAPSTWPEDSGLVVELRGTDENIAYIDLAPYPHWHHYRNLTFTASTNGPFELGLRIIVRDFEFSYANRIQSIVDVTIGQKPATITIPLGEISSASESRPLRMNEITGLLFRLHTADEDQSIFIDEIRLE